MTVETLRDLQNRSPPPVNGERGLIVRRLALALADRGVVLGIRVRAVIVFTCSAMPSSEVEGWLKVLRFCPC